MKKASYERRFNTFTQPAKGNNGSDRSDLCEYFVSEEGRLP
jgi:hypothetical protein